MIFMYATIAMMKIHLRKPNNMMFLDAAKKWKIDLSNSYLVGDRKKDIDAGIKSGCKTFFIDYNYDEDKPKTQITWLNLFLKQPK